MTAISASSSGVPGRWVGRAADALPAVVVFVATIALWEVIVQNIEIRGFPLPPPSDIVAALQENWTAGRWPLLKAATATL
ncbi:MAG TPA: hypothetical protein VLA44_07955, partial [Clostridia bacterium]|nr:hypothetical protein [Clostridia bacterium]